MKFCETYYYDHTRGLPPDTKNFLRGDSSVTLLENDEMDEEENKFETTTTTTKKEKKPKEPYNHTKIKKLRQAKRSNETVFLDLDDQNKENVEKTESKNSKKKLNNPISVLRATNNKTNFKKESNDDGQIEKSLLLIEDMISTMKKEREDSKTQTNLLIKNHKEELKALLKKSEDAEKKQKSHEMDIISITTKFNQNIEALITSKNTMKNEINEMKLKQASNINRDLNDDKSSLIMNQILNECCEQRKPVAQTTNVASFDSFAKLLVLARVAMN